METEVGERLHVVGLVAPLGEFVIEHVRDTVPVKELEGVTVMVEVLPLVAPGVTLMLPLFDSVKSLLPLGASQNPEQPAMNAVTSGAKARAA